MSHYSPVVLKYQNINNNVTSKKERLIYRKYNNVAS
jgi:hypothetical protein